MSENKLDAVVDKVVGATKEVAGKVTGNKKLQAEGKTQKAGGKVKEVVADAKDVVDGVVDGTKEVLGKKK